MPEPIAHGRFAEFQTTSRRPFRSFRLLPHWIHWGRARLTFFFQVRPWNKKGRKNDSFQGTRSLGWRHSNTSSHWEKGPASEARREKKNNSKPDLRYHSRTLQWSAKQFAPAIAALTRNQNEQLIIIRAVGLAEQPPAQQLCPKRANDSIETVSEHAARDYWKQN